MMDLKAAEREIKGDHIAVGMATCGLSAGAKEVFEALETAKLDLPLTKVGCVGMCYNEPIVLVVQDGKSTYYGNVVKDNISELIECIRQRKRCDKLFVCEKLEDLDFYKKQVRLTMSNCGAIDPLKIDHYIFTGGYEGLKKAK
jgi:NADH-quinone oxidoreductase subunit F